MWRQSKSRPFNIKKLEKLIRVTPQNKTDPDSFTEDNIKLKKINPQLFKLFQNMAKEENF